MVKLFFVLCLVAVVTIGLVTVWKAEAAPLGGAVGSLAVIKNYSAIEKVGCMFGTSRCPAGSKWQCFKHPTHMGTGKTCACRPC